MEASDRARRSGDYSACSARASGDGMSPERMRNSSARSWLVGVNWDLLWVPVAAAGLVVVLHLFLRTRRRAR